MNIINDQKKWDAEVRENKPRSGAFLQSWAWGEFQNSLGKEVFRFDGVGQMIKTTLHKKKHYLFCPRGPILKKGQDFGDVFSKFRELFSKDKELFFVRFEPTEEIGVSNFSSLLHKTVDAEPPETLITDLSKSEDELLSSMHQKTRYNIKLAKKKGVEVQIEAVPEKDIWDLFDITAKRGSFRLHPISYYEKMLEALNGDNCHAYLATATFEGETIAVNIMIDFDGTRTYLHGASSNAYRNVMAPFLLHWELILAAKAKGMLHYDWWGIAPESATKEHAWYGITRFKLGYGGERVSYPGTFDLAKSRSSYIAYSLVRVLRRKF